MSPLGLLPQKFTPLLARSNLPLPWAAIAKRADPSPLSFCFHVLLCASCVCLGSLHPQVLLPSGFQLEASGGTSKTAEEQKEKESGHLPNCPLEGCQFGRAVSCRDIIPLRPFITRAVDGCSWFKASRCFTIFHCFTQPGPQLCK